VGYPNPQQEVEVLNRQIKEHPIHAVQAVVTREEVLEMQDQVKDIHIDPSLKEYLVQVVTATRGHEKLSLGGSPRASLGLMRTSQARAVLAGREYVIPDDIKAMAAAVLCHRLVLRPGVGASGGRRRQAEAAQVVAEVLDKLPVPAAS
jgi:MoxR-like ATPase